MVMRSSAQSVSKGGTGKGVLLLLILTALSVLSINISGRQVSLVFLPLIAVLLWPRIDNPNCVYRFYLIIWTSFRPPFCRTSGPLVIDIFKCFCAYSSA